MVEEANVKPPDSASSLFEEASAARRRGRMLEAAGLYRDLEARFPASPEARLSIAVVARMELDLGEAAAAASGFGAYLATGDRALREEAMAGRAIALGRLGRTSDEVAAWRELLRAYPGSSYANVARTRLEQDLP
jgi:outer membrane protein assembly factor BamD (BamD/ComL family)